MTKTVKIGNLQIGGGNRVAVQSMTTFKASDTENTVRQINALERAGAEIVRFAVSDMEDARAVKVIKSRTSAALVADVQYDYRLAIAAAENGIDKVRVNPGNIGGSAKIRAVADCLKANGVPVRVGTNSGSIDKDFLQKYGKNEISLCESALRDVAAFEDCGVEDIVISVKASDAVLTVRAYEYIAARCAYPLHIGVTEAGTLASGVVKSSVALGSLLLKGIGDTLRVSLAADPLEEVVAAKRILRSVGLERDYAEVISCPTCGRCDWNSIELAGKIERLTSGITKPLKIAVMGCAVNGVGEASDCDIGIAGSGKYAVIFKNGKIIAKVDKKDAEKAFTEEIEKLL